MPDNKETCDVGIKAAVVIQLLRNDRTVEELAIAYRLNADEILRWKKQVIDHLPAILAAKDNRPAIPHGHGSE
jgi:uncharacterized protein (DUF433 family)